MKRILFVFMFSLAITTMYAQQQDSISNTEDDQIQSDDEQEPKYRIAITLGITHIPKAFENGHEEDALFVPTIGIDFFYRIKQNWSLGLMTDFEFAEYIVDFNREDLNRNNALILTLMTGYEIKPRWEILVGAGIEIESNKNLAVLRVGTEYAFSLANNWNIGPSLFFDFKEEYSTWAIAIGVSKTF